MKTEFYNESAPPGKQQKEEIIDFLYKHLEEFGDPREDIEKAVDYALKESDSFGGFLLVAKEEETISGAVVLNRTGMEGYIPENILVYIATHKKRRGKGIGKHLMKETIKRTNGDVALHVEPDNPARFLYEKVGFRSKYKEMRFKSKAN